MTAAPRSPKRGLFTSKAKVIYKSRKNLSRQFLPKMSFKAASIPSPQSLVADPPSPTINFLYPL